MSLTKSGTHVAKMLLMERVEIGILSNISYQYFKKTHSFDMDLFYKSDTPDGVYDTALLINLHNTKITANQFEQVINVLAVKNDIQSLFNKYGIQSTVIQR